MRFDHGISKNVSTNSPSYRVPSGVGVGSTRAAIAAAYGVRCFPDEGVPTPCMTATRTIAGVPLNMTFWLKGGRAVSFDLGVATSQP